MERVKVRVSTRGFVRRIGAGFRRRLLPNYSERVKLAKWNSERVAGSKPGSNRIRMPRMRVRATLNKRPGRAREIESLASRTKRSAVSNHRRRGRKGPEGARMVRTNASENSAFPTSAFREGQWCPASMKASESARKDRRRCSIPRRFRFSLDSLPLRVP